MNEPKVDGSDGICDDQSGSKRRQTHKRIRMLKKNGKKIASGSGENWGPNLAKGKAFGQQERITRRMFRFDVQNAQCNGKRMNG